MEDLEIRRKRLLFRAIYTGMKETDLLVGGFARVYLGDFDHAQLDMFEKILSAGDPQIYAWLAGREAVPEDYNNDVMKLLLDFKATQVAR